MNIISSKNTITIRISSLNVDKKLLRGNRLFKTQRYSLTNGEMSYLSEQFNTPYDEELTGQFFHGILHLLCGINDKGLSGEREYGSFFKLQRIKAL